MAQTRVGYMEQPLIFDIYKYLLILMKNRLEEDGWDSADIE